MNHMEKLKLTSIRLDRQSLEQADNIAKDYTFYTSSDVIRTALWIGFKIINSRNYPRLTYLHWDEDAHGARYELEDVLHAVEPNNEGAR